MKKPAKNKRSLLTFALAGVLMLMGMGCGEEENNHLDSPALCVYENSNDFNEFCNLSTLVGSFRIPDNYTMEYSFDYERNYVKFHVEGTFDCVIIGIICDQELDESMIHASLKNNVDFYETNINSPLAGLKYFFISLNKI